MTDLDLDKLEALAKKYGQHEPGGQISAASILALIAALREARGEIEKQRRKFEIQSRAIDRWVPCPDHRDKVNLAHEPQRCQVCRAEAAEAELARAGKVVEAARKMHIALGAAHQPHHDHESAGWTVNDAWVALSSELTAYDKDKP